MPDKCMRCSALYTRDDTTPSPHGDLCPVCLPHRAFIRPWGEGITPMRLIVCTIRNILDDELEQFVVRGRGKITTVHIA